jgi:hypothetical protein
VNPGGRFLVPSDADGEPPVVITKLELAPKGYWGVRCFGPDHHWFPRPRKPSDDMNICLQCGAGLDDTLALVEDDVEVVMRPQAVFEREWWHATPSARIDPIRTSIMHWGSEEAALERAHVMLSPWRSERIFLHRAMVHPGCAIAPDVFIERPGYGANHDDGHALMPPFEVVRYINGTEAPGGTSIMVRAQSLTDVRFIRELRR